MKIEIGFIFPAGTWVAQQRNGSWTWHSCEPTLGLANKYWNPHGERFPFFYESEQNPYWQDTKHQIQPGETIWLSL